MATPAVVIEYPSGAQSEPHQPVEVSRIDGRAQSVCEGDMDDSRAVLRKAAPDCSLDIVGLSEGLSGLVCHW